MAVSERSNPDFYGFQLTAVCIQMKMDSPLAVKGSARKLLSVLLLAIFFFPAGKKLDRFLRAIAGRINFQQTIF